MRGDYLKNQFGKLVRKMALEMIPKILVAATDRALVNHSELKLAITKVVRKL